MYTTENVKFHHNIKGEAIKPSLHILLRVDALLHY